MLTLIQKNLLLFLAEHKGQYFSTRNLPIEIKVQFEDDIDLEDSLTYLHSKKLIESKPKENLSYKISDKGFDISGLSDNQKAAKLYIEAMNKADMDRKRKEEVENATLQLANEQLKDLPLNAKFRKWGFYVGLAVLLIPILLWIINKLKQS